MTAPQGAAPQERARPDPGAHRRQHGVPELVSFIITARLCVPSSGPPAGPPPTRTQFFPCPRSTLAAMGASTPCACVYAAVSWVCVHVSDNPLGSVRDLVSLAHPAPSQNQRDHARSFQNIFENYKTPRKHKAEGFLELSRVTYLLGHFPFLPSAVLQNPMRFPGDSQHPQEAGVSTSVLQPSHFKISFFLKSH